MVVRRRDEAIDGWRNWLLEDPLVHPYKGLVWCLLHVFFCVSFILLLVVLGFLVSLLGLMRYSERPGFTYLFRCRQREASLEEFAREVDGWLPVFPVVSLPGLTGKMLADVVRRKSATAGSLDGWGWRKLKVLPVPCFGSLARVLLKVEEIGVWSEGLLDDFFAMIPKANGDATPLGQRVLHVVYRIWACARMIQLEGWFKSWVPDSVYSAGGGRCSVEAWYTTALDNEEVLSGVVDSDVHLFVTDDIGSFDTVDRGVLDGVCE